MMERSLYRRHIAVFDDPKNAQIFSTLEVVREFVRRGQRVTYVTSTETATRLSPLNATDDTWASVGALDDSPEPAALLRGYFAGDRPDLFVYCANAFPTVASLLTYWKLPAYQLIPADLVEERPRGGETFGDGLCEFLAGFGCSLVPHRRSAPVAAERR